jgi:hypothetical protein
MESGIIDRGILARSEFPSSNQFRITNNIRVYSKFGNYSEEYRISHFRPTMFLTSIIGDIKCRKWSQTLASKPRSKIVGDLSRLQARYRKYRSSGRCPAKCLIRSSKMINIIHDKHRIRTEINKRLYAPE